MKYNEITESLSSSSLSSSCSEGKINHVISQPKYKSSSLSSSCSEGNVINRVIREPNYKSSLVSTELKSSSEEPNTSEDDGSPSSINTSNFKEEKEKQLPLVPVNGKNSSQKGASCMLAVAARKDSVLLKGEWPEDTVNGTNSPAAATKGPSDKFKSCVAKLAGGGLHVKEEGKNPLDQEVSNLLLQMLQERSPPPTIPSTTRGLQHEPMTLVKSNSVSATKADNILKVDYITAGSNITTSHDKQGHRLSTGDSPLYMQKRYGSQGPALLRTGFPSPGTPSRSSFSGVPTAMMINNKAYMVGRIAVNEGNGKLLPLYNVVPPSSDQETINPGRLSVGFSSRAAPPSKWDDAEKWLVNASPSHPSQLPPHPSKQANYLNYTESKKNPTNNKKVINVVASSSPPSLHTPTYTHTPKDTSMLYQSRSLVPLPSPSTSDSQMHELAETMSDTELSNTHEECKVFVRSASHKHIKESDYGNHRNIVNKSQPVRKSVLMNNSKEELHVSSPVSLQLERLKLGSANTHHEQLPKMHDVYAVECADGAPCGNDEVAEGGGGGGGLARLVVQAGQVVGRWGAGAMRDASTDVSPKVSMSRRDMGTQMTPVASSKTSRSATPLRNSSPVRHNTPMRAKQAAMSAHSPARGKAASSSADPHHLDLQNCHLEKLENSHVTCHAGSDSSTTSLSTTSYETSSSSWKSLQDNASDHHIHKKDQSSSAQEPLKMQEYSAAAQYTAWEEAERSKHLTKYAREEARIDAWESHQKAKAEAEMKKLEMKLERLRAQATEKIMNKVAAAHLRAEEMRAAARAQQAEQLAKSLERANSISRKGGGYFQESLGVCFSLLP